MHFREQHTEPLMELGEYVFRGPTPNDFCQYLATRVCPSGELTRVYVGRLDNDGKIRTATSFGYSLESQVIQIVTPLELLSPMSDAVRNKKIIVANRENILKKYSNLEPLDVRSPWVSTAIIPTFNNYVYVFGLQCRVDDQESADSYFRLVGMLLNFYNFEYANWKNHLFPQFKRRGETIKPSAIKGAPLTERQDLIVSLIRERKTNGHISKLLGYSESLIKHETILIYQKLGINGRRDLI
jgi:DNA-binding CsgD family transcriptional regulator